MKFKISYVSDHSPNEEIVEADDFDIADDWAVFKRNLAQDSTPVLRIRATSIMRIELVPDQVHSKPPT